MSFSTMDDYKTSWDKSTTRIDNVTSLVKGMVVGPQSHSEGPPTVPSGFGILVDPIGVKQPPEIYVLLKSTASQRRSGDPGPAVPPS